MINKRRHRIQDHHPPPRESSSCRHKFVLQTNYCRRSVCGNVLSVRRIRKLILVMFKPTNCQVLLSIVFALSTLSTLPTAFAAFGDRLVSLPSTTATTSTSTQSPFNNYKKSYHLRTPSTSTTEAPDDTVTFSSFENASPDPENESSEIADGRDNDHWKNLNATSGTENVGIDDLDDENDDEDDDWYYDGYPYNYLYDFDPDELDRASYFEDNDTTSSYLNTSSSEIINYNYNDSMEVDFEDGEDENVGGNSYNMYPLEPPKLNQAYVNSSGNDSISSSGTYSHHRYAPAPYANPFDPTHQIKKVVFINPVNPKPGHHHTPLNVHKIYSGIGSHIPSISGRRGGSGHYIPGPPIYRDTGPRIKYVPTGLKHPRRLPAHFHIKKYPSGKLGPIHSHEYHHHPNKDPSYYGYIPGIPGRPWKDYPMYSHVPRTGFHCKLVKYPGFYADVDTGCQVWHYCQPDGRHDKFLCPNGTLFNQQTRVCEWWFNVDCPSSVYKYNINADLYKQYKKILHIHPGVKPHVHKVAVRPKYHLTSLGGMRVHGQHISNKWRKYPGKHYPHPHLSRKVHQHHIVKESGHGGGQHPLTRKKVHHIKHHHKPSHLSKPHHKTHHHHKMFHHRGHGHPMMGGGHHGNKHHYPHPLPEIPPHFHIPKHHHQPHPEIPSHHHIPMSRHHPSSGMGHGTGGHGYVIKRGPHGILKVKKKIMAPHSHNIPLLDHYGRYPHHGHLILHHRVK